MSNRTFSLLMLYLAALMTAGVVLGPVVTFTSRVNLSTPWIVPAVVFCCEVAALFAGRRYILPYALATSARRSAIVLTSVVALTMAAAYAGLWLVQAVIGRERMAPVVGLAFWFLLLWLVVRREQNRYADAKIERW